MALPGSPFERLRRRASYANVVSTLCLVLALGGGAAYAATQLPKNSVGSKQLKANAVTGAKVKNGSLTGADLNLSTLGTVPSANHATSADSAANAGSADRATRADSATHATSADQAAFATEAATLGGLGPSALVPAGNVRRLDFAAPMFATETTLLSLDGLVLSAVCTEGGLAGSTVLVVSAASGAPGAELDVQLVKSTSSPEVGESSAQGFGLGSTASSVAFVFRASGAPGQQAVGTLVYHDSVHTISIPVEMRATSAETCQLSGAATATP